jgi:hypothetical protein
MKGEDVIEEEMIEVHLYTRVGLMMSHVNVQA